MRPTAIDDDGIERMLEAVAAVPPGSVITYADLSELARYGGPRTAGAVMARHGSGVPWHRVVAAHGRLPAQLQGQALARWREESTPLAPGGDRVEVSQARWQPTPAERASLAASGVGGSDHDGAVSPAPHASTKERP